MMLGQHMKNFESLIVLYTKERISTETFPSLARFAHIEIKVLGM